GDWAAFVSNLATHYALACQSDPTLCVEAYEVWNEPGTGVGHWKGTPAQYAQLLSTAYDAIHAADSQATVLNGGLTSVGPNPSDWLAQVMTDSRFPCVDKIDIPAIHLRGPTAEVASKVVFWRREFDQY